MSKTILLNHSNWHFTKENAPASPPPLWVRPSPCPTPGMRWTVRTAATLITTAAPAGIRWPWQSPPSRQAARLFCNWTAAAMTAAVYLNGEKLAQHKGGYSTFPGGPDRHLGKSAGNFRGQQRQRHRIPQRQTSLSTAAFTGCDPCTSSRRRTCPAQTTVPPR